MSFLRQATASQEILLGRFVDNIDGDTEKLALPINNTDIKLWVEGGITVASKNSGGATHISNGLYYCVLDAVDTANCGKLEVHVHVAGALAVKREYVVLPPMIYDSLVLGTEIGFVKAIKTIITGVVGSGSTLTSIVLASVSANAGDVNCWRGLIVKFPGDTTTANLRGEGTDITANTTGATPTLTVTALSTAPVAGDVVVIQ